MGCYPGTEDCLQSDETLESHPQLFHISRPSQATDTTMNCFGHVPPRTRAVANFSHVPLGYVILFGDAFTCKPTNNVHKVGDEKNATWAADIVKQHTLAIMIGCFGFRLDLHILAHAIPFLYIHEFGFCENNKWNPSHLER